MQEQPKPVSLPYQAAIAKEQRWGLTMFLTYLVYEAHGLRVGLEISLCVLSYTFVNLLVPWEQFGIPLKWSTLISWFGCCFVIILLDQCVLCRSVHTFRKSYLLGLAGAYEKALQILEQVGPQSRSLIRLPLALYHLQRAEVFTHAEDFAKAEAELQLAELVRARVDELSIRKSRYLRAKGEFDLARGELDLAQELLGETSTILLEKGWLVLDQRRDLWEAKRIFKRVLELPDAPHFAGETAHVLAQSFLSVIMLSTGEAEEGMEMLSRAIDRFRGAVIYVDTLRPILARLLLERSYYLATHKQPTSAVIDLKVGLALCVYAPLNKFGERIKQELLDRHAVRVF